VPRFQAANTGTTPGSPCASGVRDDGNPDARTTGGDYRHDVIARRDENHTLLVNHNLM
jgi:hypothetical protein